MIFNLNQISLDNLFRPDFNGLIFSLTGILIVFSGLMVISLYITLLPRLMEFSQRKQKKSDEEQKSRSSDAARDEKERLIAIAVAFHLDQNFPEENQKITWKSQKDVETPWQISGRVHGLAARSHVGLRR